MIGRLHITAEICAVDLRNFAFAADMRALHFRSDGFADFVGEDKGGFVLDIQIARKSQSVLALDLAAMDRNRCEIGAQRELVEGEQRPAGKRERVLAPLAAETKRSARAPFLVGFEATASRTDRLAMVAGQRIEANSVSASVSLMRITVASESVRALEERRKC